MMRGADRCPDTSQTRIGTVSVVVGTVAERTNAPALKADEVHASGGSNPPRSAIA